MELTAVKAQVTGGRLDLLMERAIMTTNGNSNSMIPAITQRMYGPRKTTRFAEYLSLLIHNYSRQQGEELSYRDLSEIAGVPVITLHKWIAKGTQPSIEPSKGGSPNPAGTLEGISKLALFFGIDIEQFTWRIREDNDLTRLADELAYNGYGELLNMLWELYNNKPVRIRPDIEAGSDVEAIVGMVRNIYNTVKQAKQDI